MVVHSGVSCSGCAIPNIRPRNRSQQTSSQPNSLWQVYKSAEPKINAKSGSKRLECGNQDNLKVKKISNLPWPISLVFGDEAGAVHPQL